jgi:hypothetical protein
MTAAVLESGPGEMRMTDVRTPDGGSPDMLRHIRDEMTVQLDHSLARVRGGDEPDHCERWVQAVQDGSEALSQSKDLLNEELNQLDVMHDVKRSWQRHLEWVAGRLEQYPDNEKYKKDSEQCLAALEEMDREIRDQEDEVHDLREQVVSDKAAIKRDLAALKRCREDHPYEHHCGERGGPGVRRPGPNGKCMSWDEINDLTD